MHSGKNPSVPPDNGAERTRHVQNANHDACNAIKGSANITRTSTTAEFPSRSSSDSLRTTGSSIFRRDDFIGGPVTTATIRFPPRYIADDIDEKRAVKYNLLKSQGRVVFARGSWIESHPLSPCYSNYSGNNDDGIEFSSSVDNKQESIIQDEVKTCYKTLAFGGDDSVEGGGTSTFETVSGMIFPSSTSSLSYLDDDPSPTTRVELILSTTRRISLVAFGGRRVSFFSGGGLWTCRHGILDTRDEFVSIPIASKTDSVLTHSYLELSDWIHDVRFLNIVESQREMDNCSTTFLLALGTANNSCEIFGFQSTARTDDRDTLQYTRLRCISCDVRCMTYSLSFHGWDDDASVLSSDVQLPSLAVASGTVFSEIIVWNAVIESMGDNDNDESLDKLVTRWLAETITGCTNIKASRIREASLHRLEGHLGSVFSVHFSPCGQFIASTSDDRTVRLFQLQPTDESKSKKKGNLIWTGWGHTARIFDVSFAYPSFDCGEYPILVSAGEDSTTRIWSPLQTKEVAHPLRGHDCESVWTVDVCEGIIITGGNDGCVKLWDLTSRRGHDVRAFVVPKDPLVKTTSSEEGATAEATKTKPRKKQKKKNKANGQQICGMELHRDHFLVIATKAGAVFCLNLKSSTWSFCKNWHDNVISSKDKCRLQIDPTTGTCINVSPSTANAIVGTTEGWLVFVSLDSPSDSPNQSSIAFHSPPHRPVQSISWIDDDNLLVFFARGSVIWFKNEEDPVPLHKMTLGTSGIPLSFAYDYKQSVYIGDSRGNLAYFDISQLSENEITPNSVLKAHAKEHVTAVTVTSTGIIVSVGNDGCMHESKVVNGRLHALVSIPVPATTGLKHIWNVLHPNGKENVVLGGFYGNDYVVTDNVNGYEFLRIPTGGRQKRQDFCPRFSNNSYAMAICTGQKDGSNVIDFYSSQSWFEETSSMPRPRHQMIDRCYNIGHSYHAETVNSIAWVKFRGEQPTYLLSGSNDCSVKLLEFRNGIFVSTKELPPHESCVRGTCASSHPTTNTSLLVTCGGKLTMECYILDHTSLDINSSVSTLCSYRTTGSKATIDHRMNAVSAVPLPSSKNYHLIVSGDSEGNLHVVIVSEYPNNRRTTIGNILRGNGRPVLCIQLVTCNDYVLAFAGTTGGDIQLWAFNIAKLIGCCDEADYGSPKLTGVLPLSYSFEFKAHQSGVNDLSAATVLGENESVLVCSVGDDQTVSTCLIRFASFSPTECKDIRISTTKCASASALKAVKLILDDSTFHRVYTSGHDEKVTLWKLDFDHLSLKYIVSLPTGTEGSSLDCCQYKRSDGTCREVVAVGGVGTELLSFNINTLLASRALKDSNYLLITAGAGFSADSGLQTYEQAPCK